MSDIRSNGQRESAGLFSTDINLNAEENFEYNQARFSREFIFIKSQHFTGLSDCQFPHCQQLYLYLNASITAMKLAKYQADNCHSSSQTFVF